MACPTGRTGNVETGGAQGRKVAGGAALLPEAGRSSGICSRISGFSLLELVVVMAMFAVVALIGVQVIAQVMRTDQRLTEVNAETAELAYGLALLRDDLTDAIDLPFYPPNALPLPALDAPARENRFALSLGGQATFDGSGPGWARVIWRLDPGTGQITRQRWPALIPGAGWQASPEVVIFDDATALTVEGYDPATGWSVGFPKPDSESAALPRALRVTLMLGGLDRIETVVTLR